MAVHNEIGKSFNKQATEYEGAAKVQQEIGKRLLERLQYFKISPHTILDLGCGPGTFTKELTRIFPKAKIFGLDLAPAMLVQAKKKQSWRCKWPLVVADMNNMPFTSGFFDLVFANQVIHWACPQERVFRELNRVMKPNACLLFSTLGPDTFKELKRAWSAVHHYAHVNEFSDMHDIGDRLMAEYFMDPVMDMELLTVHYKTLPQLLRALKAQGVKNIHPDRNKGLTGKASWQDFEKNYTKEQREKGVYALTYEVVYGQAWKGDKGKTAQGTETFIPLERLRSSIRKS